MREERILRVLFMTVGVGFFALASFCFYMGFSGATALILSAILSAALSYLGFRFAFARGLE